MLRKSTATLAKSLAAGWTAVAALGVLASCFHASPPPAGGPGARPASAGSRPAASAPQAPQAPQATTDAPLVARTTLAYTRTSLFVSVNRPTGFGFLRDYRSAGAGDVVTLDGAWNDATQTLTADVTITLRSENLVFVDDPAVTPGAETPLRALRSGALNEIACPEGVMPQHPCYLLQVLR